MNDKTELGRARVKLTLNLLHQLTVHLFQRMLHPCAHTHTQHTCMQPARPRADSLLSPSILWRATPPLTLTQFEMQNFNGIYAVATIVFTNFACQPATWHLQNFILMHIFHIFAGTLA